MNRYHWNVDTVNHFRDMMYLRNHDEVFIMMRNFVKYECDLEDGETYEDLLKDLYERIYN